MSISYFVNSYSKIASCRSKTCKPPSPKSPSKMSQKSTLTSSEHLYYFAGHRSDMCNRNLEKQVESGNMKLAEEKRALQEISSFKRNRRLVEGFQTDQEAIDADRAKVDEIRKELDDPVSKAASERYDAIRAELDEIKKEGDEAYAGRSKLFEERDNIQNELNKLFNAKRESSQSYREANDRYWNKVNEDRARRAEKARLQRATEEAEKKKEIAERLLEEAQSPAFQAQIEDCQTLIDYFSGKNTGNVSFKSITPLYTRSEVAGVPKLEIRKVEEAPEGLVARKKKGEEETNYFVANKKPKANNNKKGTKPNTVAQEDSPKPAASSASATLNVPLPTLSALLSLSIPPPASQADVPRVVEDLTTKKTWFEANQARQTEENVAKAQKEIQRLGAKDDIVPPNGNGEDPAEPVPTPHTGALAEPVSSDEVVDKLEEVVEEAKEDATESD